MQQKLLAFLKKAMASIMSIIASLSIFGGSGDVADKSHHALKKTQLQPTTALIL